MTGYLFFPPTPHTFYIHSHYVCTSSRSYKFLKQLSSEASAWCLLEVQLLHVLISKITKAQGCGNSKARRGGGDTDGLQGQDLGLGRDFLSAPLEVCAQANNTDDRHIFLSLTRSSNVYQAPAVPGAALDLMQKKHASRTLTHAGGLVRH